MIAFWYDLFGELYVCWSTTTTTSDFSKNGQTKLVIDYCKTFADGRFDPCSIFYLQRYDF